MVLSLKNHGTVNPAAVASLQALSDWSSRCQRQNQPWKENLFSSCLSDLGKVDTFELIRSWFVVFSVLEVQS